MVEEQVVKMDETAKALCLLCPWLALLGRILYAKLDRQLKFLVKVVVQLECGTRILRVIHGRDTRVTLSMRHCPFINCLSPQTCSVSLARLKPETIVGPS